MNEPTAGARARSPVIAALPILAGIAALLALAWFAYRPGLDGGFLFDDYINLDALGRFRPLSGSDALLRYLTSGTADPFGRPLALLTFLLDGSEWPTAPGPFLRTNLLLHLGIGLLLFGWLRHLSRALGDGPRASAIALVGTALWLLHPLLVSTTLYPVQREAMLPSLFVIGGLWLYGHGRLRHAASDGREGTVAIVVGIVAGTALAMACKANGVLLPLLALVLEATVYPTARSLAPRAMRRLRRLRILLLGLPIAVVVLYLGSFVGHLGDVPANRDWSLAQRLLTEPRVLLDYLGQWLVPRSVSTGLYNDAYVVSTGPTTPATTLPALLLVLALPIAALAWRRRAPALAAAVLFYFAGHLLESTVVPLELYFEHRNYLPALLLGWPLARAIVRWKVPVPARAATAFALVALLAVTTWQRASLWGDPPRLARLWVQQSPDSPRAQATAAQLALRDGRGADAHLALARALQSRPDEPQLAIAWVIITCAGPGVGVEQDVAMRKALQQADSGQMLVLQSLGDWIEPAAAGTCAGLTLARVEAWLAAAQANPRLVRNATARQNVQRLHARLALARGDAAAASARFEAALAESPSPSVAVADAGLLAGHGHPAEALALLDAYERLPPPPRPRAGMRRLHAAVLARQDYWPQRIATLRTRLAAAPNPTDGATR